VSGTFPDTTNFTTLSFRDTKAVLKNTDGNNKLYEKFLKQHWELALKSTLLTRAQLGTAYGFIAKQNGQAETFTIVPPNIGSTQGTMSGTVTCNATVAVGQSSVTATGGGGTFKKGDLIKFSNHTKVYQLSADTTSDGSTAFTINIYPTLQTAVSNTTTVTYNDVPMTVALIGDDPDFDTDEKGLYRYGIDVREEY
jgi:hypothetical protein